MVMVGRKYEAVNGYRYGFAGQEKSTEINSEGNSYTAEFWEYNSRLGRRWNTDIVIRPYESPYACFLNNPIKFSDNNGDDPIGNQYKIKKGDTYTSIAKNSNGKVTVDQLIKWNKGVDPTKLQIGQNINISDPAKGALVGSKGRVGTDEDATFGGGSSGQPVQQPTTPEGVRQLKNYNNNESQAIYNYKNANNNATFISNCSVDVGDDVDKTVSRFLSKNGGIFTDYTKAEKEFENSSIYSSTRDQIAKQFQASMRENNGDLSKVNISGTLPNPPGLGGLCKSMAALFGGTQQIDVYLMDITLKADRTYTAVFKGIIWDDYGVSTKDFTKDRGFIDGGAQLGLTGMWVLQHQYGYKPLINGLKFTFTASGTY